MRAFILGSCLAVAVTLAFTVNQLIDSALVGTPGSEPPRAPPIARPTTELDAARLGRILGTPLRPRPPPPVRRAMPLKLLGTLDPHAAAMLDPSTGQCRTLRVGDAWDDVTLVEVGHRSITVARGGVLEQLGIGASLPGPPASSAQPLAISLRERGATIAISRQELERRLPEFVDAAMKGGRLVPAFTGSTMTGLTISGVRPDSLYQQLGLKNGDVVEAINGTPLGSLDLGVGALTQLRNQSHLALVVNRGGDRLSWELNVN